MIAALHKKKHFRHFVKRPILCSIQLRLIVHFAFKHPLSYTLLQVFFFSVTVESMVGVLR